MITNEEKNNIISGMVEAQAVAYKAKEWDIVIQCGREIENIQVIQLVDEIDGLISKGSEKDG